MRYERFQPEAALAPYVEHFWLIEADLGSVWRDEILVPNGRPTLLFSLGTPGRRKDPDTSVVTANASGFSGIVTRPVIIGQTSKVSLVAAQLRPFGPLAFDSTPHIDRHVPMAEWAGAETAAALQAALMAEGPSHAAVKSLARWLTARLRPMPATAVADLNRIYSTLDDEIPADIDSWAATAGLSRNRLYRLFRAYVGISPKAALMIARYQALMGKILADAGGDGLAQLALLQGYYDQAHANRDFRRFTGVSPRSFKRTLNGIARMMHQQA
jgi:AraC-like DNA-binding protein